MNADDNETVITNNKHDEYFNTGSKERMKTESNYQNKLGANRYTEFSDYNDNNWNTHVSRYVEREEKPGRMREIEKATKRHVPKKEEAFRCSPYGKLIRRMREIGKATKTKSTHQREKRPIGTLQPKGTHNIEWRKRSKETQ